MVGVKWTNNALEEINDIASYIAKDSPKKPNILVNQRIQMARN